eukprot:354169-Chlamydomonas_euryale.AAC.30
MATPRNAPLDCRPGPHRATCMDRHEAAAATGTLGCSMLPPSAFPRPLHPSAAPSELAPCR